MEREHWTSPNRLYRLGWRLVRTYVSLLMEFDVHFQTPLPPGPKIFVANHPSAIDPFLIHLLSQEEINVLLTEKAFRVRGFGAFLRHVREICVPLETPAEALVEAQNRLERGVSVAIFIEGHISPGENAFLPPRTGAARLALATSVPVVPVGIYLRCDRRINLRSRISGDESEALWYFYGPYFMTVGAAIHWHGDPQDRSLVRKVSHQMMDQIKILAWESAARFQSRPACHPLKRLLLLINGLIRKQVISRL
ncbi:MAG: 1-acyl-sn-glycerol-3-phosphate acyltransferase [Anaerolineales bacterium]|nr:1-acyl-sn-glycerol-3-phosphate acyltransferase [Anaerolineales bacterium]MCX7607675.1 1-acyl-sn-glycerol-3-phosphate acyltransferase [Anaerolineales bacterium]MDW8226984.1 lysophospholipid acyltransferase family protein [Anaerolineales bacterium]